MKKGIIFILFMFICISAVSAEDINNFNVSEISKNSMDFHVDLGGDDANSGSADSPFKSIQRAVNVSRSQDDVTIHLGEGIFSGQNNSMIFVNKAHLSQGGFITIQGAGTDKTFINGYFTYYAFNIYSDSILILKDLSIYNCKDSNGAAIKNSGSLTVENCKIYNNIAINNGGSIIGYEDSSTVIRNSSFENNTALRGGAFYGTKSNLNVDYSIFINNSAYGGRYHNIEGGAIYCYGNGQHNTVILNSVFINNSAISTYNRGVNTMLAAGGSIYASYCILINDSFINSKVVGGNGKGGSFYYDSKYLNQVTNILRINSTVNGVLEDNIYPLNYTGEYADALSYFVSNEGSDLNGDGSENNPFKTIKKAINEGQGKTCNLNVYLKEGMYEGEGNTNLTIEHPMNIRLIGLNNVVIDGNKENYFIVFSNLISGYDIEINNLKIINCCATSKDFEKIPFGIIGGYANININECLFENNEGIILFNLDYSRLIINNSIFVNNNASISQTRDGYISFENCLINNSNTQNGYLFLINKNLANNIEIKFENTIILNANSNLGMLQLREVKCLIINSSFINYGGIDAYDNPNVIIKDSNFINGSGFRNKICFEVVNSSFIDSDLNFESSESSTFINVLFDSNVVFKGNNFVIYESAFYNGIEVKADFSNNIKLDYNYWNDNPIKMIKGVSAPSYYIIKSLIPVNLFNGSYKVILNYSLNNGEVYNAVNIPIRDVAFNLTSTDGDISPKNGILSVFGFEALGNFNNQDQVIYARFDDGIQLTNKILNEHETKTNMNLSQYEGKLGDIITVSIEVMDVKLNEKINNGSLYLLVNGNLVNIFDLSKDILTYQLKISQNISYYNISTIFECKGMYASSYSNCIFRLSSVKLETIIVSNNLVKYYKNESNFQIILKDVLNNVLSNKKIVFSINNVNYTRTTNQEGIAVISINLSPGVYEIFTYFVGDSDFKASNKANSLLVLSTLYGNNLTKMFRNDSQYYINVLDGQGNSLSNVVVTMNINGVFYNRTTNAEGIAKLNINLGPGKYILTAYHPINGLMASNYITVISNIVGNNLGMFYRDGSAYDVTILDNHGKALKGAKIVLNINGVLYDRTTNNEGKASLNINLNPGDYIITVYYGDSASSNLIHIDPMVVNVVCSQSQVSIDDYYRVMFNNALEKPIVNETVAIEVNGIRYYSQTDAKGIASLKFDKKGEYHIEAGLISNCYESKSIYSDIMVV